MRLIGYLTMITLTIITCNYMEQRVAAQEKLTLTYLENHHAR